MRNPTCFGPANDQVAAFAVYTFSCNVFTAGKCNLNDLRDDCVGEKAMHVQLCTTGSREIQNMISEVQGAVSATVVIAARSEDKTKLQLNMIRAIQDKCRQKTTPIRPPEISLSERPLTIRLAEHPCGRPHLGTA